MVIGHLLLVLLSLKIPNVTKAFIYYECLLSAVSITLPVDHYEQQFVNLFLWSSNLVQSLSFNYTSSLIPVLALWVYKDVFANKIVYDEEYTKETARDIIVLTIQILIVYTSLFLYISWIGHIYVKSEGSRVTCDKLLDNLDEGLFIIEE